MTRQPLKIASVPASTVLLLLVFLVCAIAPELKLSSVISMLAFALYVVFLCGRNPGYTVKYLPFIAAVVFNIAGCFLAEFGDFYLTELASDAGYVGSLPLLILSRWVFLEVLRFYDHFFGVDGGIDEKASYSDASRKWIEFGSTAFLLAALVLLAYVISRGPSFVLGIGRFEYKALYLTGAWGALSSLLATLVVFPALDISQGNVSRGAIGILVYFGFLFCIGCKFGEYFSALAIILIANYKSIARMKGSRFFAAMVAMVLAMCVVAVAAFALYSPSTDSSSFLFSRAAQQGQLWWKTYEQCEGKIHPDDFIVELDSAFSGKTAIEDNVGSKNGIYGIMYFTAPDDMIDAKLMRGSRYTEAGYAAAYYYFGVLGVVAFSLFMGLLIGIVQNLLVKMLNERLPICSMVIARISTLTATALGMFTITQFFTAVSLLSYLFLLFYGLVLLPVIRRRFGSLAVNHSHWRKFGYYCSLNAFESSPARSRVLMHGGPRVMGRAKCGGNQRLIF